MSSVSSIRRTVIKAACLAGAGVAMAISVMSPATAQTASEWPTKPLRFIVPYPPGGPLDAMARALAEEVREPLGQTIIVENKPGAGGNIGVDLVGRSDPDGYTLVMGAVATFAINPWLFEKLPYDPVKDFQPITLVASVPNVLIVNADFAAKNNINSVKDLIAYGKQNPTALYFASGGNGSAGHLAGELLNSRAGISATHVPFAGAAPALTALMGDQTQMMFDNLASAAPLIESGKVKALAVTTKQRSSMLPDLPTIEESGIADYDLGTWFGVFVPAGTPEDVVKRLHSVYADALNSPQIQKRLATMGSDAKPNTPQEFATMVKEEMAKYEEIVKASGAKL